MGFSKNLKWGAQVMLHPGIATKGKLTIKEMFAKYLEISIIPLILLIILNVFFRGSMFSTFYGYSTVHSVVGSVILGLLFLWVFIPVSIVVSAVIYQIIGKYLLKEFKHSIDNTIVALFQSRIPMVMLAWIFVIPIIGIAALFLTSIWTFVIMIISLSNQQKIARKDSVIVVITTLFFIALIAVLFFSLSAFLVAGSLLHSSLVGGLPYASHYNATVINYP